MDQKQPAIESAKAKTASPSAKAHDNKRKKQSPAQPWKKPPGFPKRYLSAYNLFFKQERQRLLKMKQQSDAELGEAEELVPVKPELPDPNAPKKTGPRKHARSSGIGFANLARIVAKNWKELDPALKKPFEEVAERDKERYKKEMVVWRAKEEQQKQAAAAQESEGNSTEANWNSNSEEASKPFSSQNDKSVPYDAQNDVRQGEDSPAGMAARLQGQESFPRPYLNGLGRAGTWNTYDSHLAPDGNQSAKKPTIDRSGGGSSWYGEPDRFGGSAFTPQHGQRPEGDYYGHPWWEGYNAPPYAMPYPPSYGMPYLPAGRQMHGMPYLGGDPPETRPRVLHTSEEGPYSGGYYDRYYAMPPPGPFAPPPYQETPQSYRRIASLPSYPPPPNVPPYGFQSRQPHNPAQEETWQRPASRDHFEPPQTNPVSVASKRKKTPNHPASSDSQPLSISRNEDCSVLESGETSLDNDTVDFLTTLELE